VKKNNSARSRDNNFGALSTIAWLQRAEKKVSLSLSANCGIILRGIAISARKKKTRCNFAERRAVPLHVIWNGMPWIRVLQNRATINARARGLLTKEKIARD